MKEDKSAYVQPKSYQEIHMPKNTSAGIFIGLFSLIMGFAMIWYIWWLAIAGFVGVIATWISYNFV